MQSFSKKNCQETFKAQDAAFNFSFDKPMLCPYCSAYQDATIVDQKLVPIESRRYWGIVFYKCTLCSQIYIAAFKINLFEETAIFEAMHPPAKYEVFINERISGVSPGFVRLYSQAQASENTGNQEMAVVGYRTALEVLVKDYAINTLKKPEAEVAKTDLLSAISTFLKNEDLAKSDDAVRVLTSGYDHWKQTPTPADFELLKGYLEVFIRLVDVQLMMNQNQENKAAKEQPLAIGE